MKKGLFLFADYYDATTASRRVLESTKDIFDNINFAYWAKLGTPRISNEEIFSGIEFDVFQKTAKSRSFEVLKLFLVFQIWLLRLCIRKKPKFIVAFTFFTIFPALLYKYFFNWKCKVIYDPRDYVAVSFRINKFLEFIVRLTDNIFIKLSNFVVFPDNQYFIYYGIFSLSPNKCLFLPNSSKNMFDEVKAFDIYSKYAIPKDKFIIPVLGYFSETRGQKILFDLINRKRKDLIFVFAGDIREKEYLDYFNDNNDNVIYLNKIPYLDALSIMFNSLVVPQLYDPVTKNNVYAFPTKYYDCLMVGTPIIVSDGQIDVAKEINNNHFGWVIDYYDTNKLEFYINELITNPNRINKDSLRDYFNKNYDYNLFQDKLKKIYLKFL